MLRAEILNEIDCLKEAVNKEKIDILFKNRNNRFNIVSYVDSKLTECILTDNYSATFIDF